MKTRNIIGFTAAAILTLTSLTGCGAASAEGSVSGTASESSSSDELRTLRVAIMTTQPDQYATYIGTEEGIFEKYGIKLELTEYAAGINTVDAIVNGTADTGLLADFAAVNRLGNTLNATNLNLFAELGASVANLGGVYAAPDYTDVSKLDGSAGWLTSLGTVVEYFNWQAWTYLGLDPANQNLVQTDSISTSLAAAQRGDATAVVATGAQSRRYEEIGWVKIATPAEFGYNIGSYLVTTNEFIDANTDLLADYLKALDESAKYIDDNIDSVATRVSAKFGIDEADFKDNWAQYDILLSLSTEGVEHLDSINEWAFGQGRYPEAYDVRRFIRPEAIEKAFPDRVTYNK